MRQIIKIADKAGFCFGVERAEKIVLDTLEKKHINIFTLGPLIHNPLVVENLKDKGVFPIEENDIKDIDNNSTLIIRSHGIDKFLKEKLEKKGFDIVDATCPFVKKAKEAAQTLYREGYLVLILGDKNHPEVKGIHSYTDYKGQIIKDMDDLKNLLNKTDCKKIGLVAQTTQNKDLFKEIVKYLENKELEFNFYNTICNATSLRQEAAIKLAEKSDMMLVIGGFNSANTRRLVEICKKICKNVIWIEKPEDFELKKIKDFFNIGITAGASTPIKSIEKTYNLIKNFLNGKVKENDE